MGKTRGKAQAFPFVVVCGPCHRRGRSEPWVHGRSIRESTLRLRKPSNCRGRHLWRPVGGCATIAARREPPRPTVHYRSECKTSGEPPAVKKSLQFWRMCGILVLLKAVKGKVGFLLRPKRESAATAESAFGGKNARSSPRSRAAENYK